MGLVGNLLGLGYLASRHSWVPVTQPLIIPSVIEGLATVVAGVLSFWIVQDFPDSAKFLTEAERTVVVRRLQNDDQFSAAGENLRWKYIFQSLLDWKTWVGSMWRRMSLLLWRENWLIRKVICYSGSDMPLYAFSLFLPSIINQVSLNSQSSSNQIFDMLYY